ncbi:MULTISPECIES: hypothetical protein [Jannaschia]|nr:MULTISPECIES: hypothetical protein [unclassified Jannaschia]
MAGALLTYGALRLGLAWLIESHPCGVAWLPRWWPDWAALCARDPGVIAARAVQVADWHKALPIMGACATFLLAAWPWRRG